MKLSASVGHVAHQTIRHSLICCRLTDQHKAAIRVIRRIKYFVARRKFQVCVAFTVDLPSSLGSIEREEQWFYIIEAQRLAIDTMKMMVVILGLHQLEFHCQKVYWGDTRPFVCWHWGIISVKLLSWQWLSLLFPTIVVIWVARTLEHSMSLAWVRFWGQLASYP